MTFAKELIELEAGDHVVGGSFMQALDGEEIVWTCVRPFTVNPSELLFDVSWLGVDLGRFRLNSKGMQRVDQH